MPPATEEVKFESDDQVIEDLFGEGGPSLLQAEEEPEEKPEAEIKKEESAEGESEEKSKVEKGEGEPETEEKDDLVETLKLFQLEELPKNEEDFSKVLKKAAKIVSDNRKNFNSEHESKVNLEKEFASLRGEMAQMKDSFTKKEEPAKEIDDDEFVEGLLGENFEDDPEKAVKTLAKALRKEWRQSKSTEAPKIDEAKIQNLVENRILQIEEDKFIATNPDYLEMMKDFVPILQSDRGLSKTWQDGGSTPAKAYEMAKAYKEHQEFTKDPESFRNKLKEEIKAETAKGKETDEPPKTLAGMSSKGGAPKAKSKRLMESEDDLNLWPL